jgi:hypothetical protein
MFAAVPIVSLMEVDVVLNVQRFRSRMHQGMFLFLILIFFRYLIL